jgi:exodeoxyribonuclease VII small subunit
LKLFEEGVKLSRECQTLLGEAEAKVQQLMGTNPDGSPILKDLGAENL